MPRLVSIWVYYGKGRMHRGCKSLYSISSNRLYSRRAYVNPLIPSLWPAVVVYICNISLRGVPYIQDLGFQPLVYSISNINPLSYLKYSIFWQIALYFHHILNCLYVLANGLQFLTLSQVTSSVIPSTTSGE